MWIKNPFSHKNIVLVCKTNSYIQMTWELGSSTKNFSMNHGSKEHLLDVLIAKGDYNVTKLI